MHTQLKTARERRSQPQITGPRWAKFMNDPAVWSLSILTSSISDADRQRLREALADFAANRGLQAHFSCGTTFIAPTTAPITTEDRGAVMGWLCSRPEVHFVHVRRRPPATHSFAIACSSVRRGAGLGQEGPQAQWIDADDCSQSAESQPNQQEQCNGQ